jgi:hydrogenase-1 operon protein HyaF
MKDFPIPVVAIGPGTQTEDETLDYLPMPKDMDTYRAPMLPEPEELAGRDAARAALNQVLALLDRTAQRGPGGQVSLNGMPAADLALVNQIMGEGEASALVREPDGQLEVRVQEAVLAGVWRLMTFRLDGSERRLVDDVIEVGPVPALLRAIAVDDLWPAGTMPQWVGALCRPACKTRPCCWKNCAIRWPTGSRASCPMWSTSRCYRSRPKTSVFWTTTWARAAC